MVRMIFLTMMFTVFSPHIHAQIADPRIPPAPVLHTPCNIRTATGDLGFPAMSPGIAAKERYCGSLRPLPVNTATQRLPFFCRQELKAEKRLGIPLRLRLGSVSYTDWLEQKPGAVAPR